MRRSMFENFSVACSLKPCVLSGLNIHILHTLKDT